MIALSWIQNFGLSESKWIMSYSNLSYFWSTQRFGSFLLEILSYDLSIWQLRSVLEDMNLLKKERDASWEIFGFIDSECWRNKPQYLNDRHLNSSTLFRFGMLLFSRNLSGDNSLWIHSCVEPKIIHFLGFQHLLFTDLQNKTRFPQALNLFPCPCSFIQRELFHFTSLFF